MVDTLQRLIRRVLATTGGTSAPFVDGEALPSGAAVLATSDLGHLLRESALRTLYSGGGWRGFYLQATGGGTYTSAPPPSSIRWAPPRIGSACGCLGSHWVERLPDGQWPVAKLTLMWRGPGGGNTIGGVFAATPGGDGQFWRPGDPHDAATETTTTLTRKTFSLQLSESVLAAVREPIQPGSASTTSLPEYLRGAWATFWFGAYNTSGNSASVGDVVAPVLYLTTP